MLSLQGKNASRPVCFLKIRNVGLLHVKIDNSSIERMEEFKNLGTMLTNKISIQEEIKSRLKLGNACYYSVQNLLSSSCYPKI